jgi:hypothetical protein
MSRLCIISGCSRVHYARDWCTLHYGRWQRYGSTDKPKEREPVGWYTNTAGYRIGTLTKSNYMQLEHIRIAEVTFGGPLPKGAEVHHVDENPSNNDHHNLVICQDKAYHRLLHSRRRALLACGNPNWRPCVFCGNHDDPALMMKHGVIVGRSQRQFCHRQCRIDYCQRLKARKAA